MPGAGPPRDPARRRSRLLRSIRVFGGNDRRTVDARTVRAPPAPRPRTRAGSRRGARRIDRRDRPGAPRLAEARRSGAHRRGRSPACHTPLDFRGHLSFSRRGLRAATGLLFPGSASRIWSIGDDQTARSRPYRGPIVMIGFGSIGNGTLPLIERHFITTSRASSSSIPTTATAKILDARGIRFIHQGVTRDNYRELLGAAADRGRRPGLLRQPLGRHVLARHHGALPGDRRALHRHGHRALAGLLFRPSARQQGAHQLRVARDRACRTRAQPGRDHRGVVLRRQSRHGVLVRQTGADEYRPRCRR